MSFLLCKSTQLRKRLVAYPMQGENGARIVDAYPGEVSTITGPSYDKETSTLEPWRSIPRGIDLSAYIRLTLGPRRGSTVQEVRVLYDSSIRPHEKVNCPWSLSIALYGFIDSMNLSPTGNWDQ